MRIILALALVCIVTCLDVGDGRQLSDVRSAIQLEGKRKEMKITFLATDHSNCAKKIYQNDVISSMECYFPPFQVDPLNHIHYNLRVGQNRKLYIDWMSYKVNGVGRMHDLYEQTYLLDPNGEERVGIDQQDPRRLTVDPTTDKFLTTVLPKLHPWNAIRKVLIKVGVCINPPPVVQPVVQPVIQQADRGNILGLRQRYRRPNYDYYDEDDYYASQRGY
jgi:hypothetical protein